MLVVVVEILFLDLVKFSMNMLALQIKKLTNRSWVQIVFFFFFFFFFFGGGGGGGEFEKHILGLLSNMTVKF